MSGTNELGGANSSRIIHFDLQVNPFELISKPHLSCSTHLICILIIKWNVVMTI